MVKNNMGNLLKQAQQMQTKMTSLQKELELRELNISAGGGAIKIKINGKQEILELKIDREAVDSADVEALEELVLTGVNQAVRESQEMVSSAMGKLTGGLNMPGLF